QPAHRAPVTGAPTRAPCHPVSIYNKTPARRTRRAPGHGPRRARGRANIRSGAAWLHKSAPIA
ncbi:hypothetical protein D0817_25905, partial [Flavobacterium cupreum]